MNIWQILEIDETKDQQVIKKAYARLLIKYHPEEYPEEFDNIQKAYQQALAYAKGNEEEVFTTITYPQEPVMEKQNILLDSVEDYEEFYSLKHQRINDFIRELVDAIIDNDDEWLNTLLDDERNQDLKHTPDFNVQLAFHIQLNHSFLTTKQIEILKFHTCIIDNFSPQIYDTYLLRTFYILEMYRVRNSEFFHMLLGTTNETMITKYKHYIEAQIRNPRKMFDDLDNNVSVVRRMMATEKEEELIMFFEQSIFLNIKYNIVFVEKLCELIVELRNLRMITNNIEGIIKEQYKGKDDYISLKVLNTLNRIELAHNQKYRMFGKPEKIKPIKSIKNFRKFSDLGRAGKIKAYVLMGVLVLLVIIYIMVVKFGFTLENINILF